MNTQKPFQKVVTYFRKYFHNKLLQQEYECKEKKTHKWMTKQIVKSSSKKNYIL